MTPVSGTGSEVKTNELEKSYKNSGALDLKHRRGMSCGREKKDEEWSSVFGLWP